MRTGRRAPVRLRLMSTNHATFGAGCFWGVEAEFRRVEGVVNTEVGYAGGPGNEVTYEEVCSGRSGHAEVVHIEFDPERVSFDDLLGVFFSIHDPTQLNRQGPDIGTQYRSVVFVRDDEQHAAATASIKAQGEGTVTEVAPFTTYARAEDYHQQYLAKRGQIACASTIRR